MKVLLAVPSKKRASVFTENVYSWLKFFKSKEADWRVFLEKEDVADYAFVSDRIVELPESNLGLGYAKQCIKKYAEENGYDYIFKVDDDIKGWTSFRQVLLGEDAAIRCNSFIGEIIDAMESWSQVAVVSFPYSFQMFEDFKFKRTKRVQTAYFTRIEDFHADPAISVFEDFSVGLNAIVKNKLVLQYGSGIVMGVKVGGGAGGHQSYDRQARAMKEITELRKIYPPLGFRKVKKVWGYEPDLRSVKVGLYL